MEQATVMEQIYGTFLQRVYLWGYALLYGIVVSGFHLKTAFTVGFRKYFNWETVDKPACLEDPTLGTHGYLHLEDVRIHYVASGPEDKPLMLFVHGFPDFWYTWRYQIKEFQKDYRVVAFDMRGYGDSDKPQGISSYTHAKLASDVKQVVLALGYKSCTLVAHDWGGAIAWAVGRLYPDVVDKLVVLNAPPGSALYNQLQNNPDQRKRAWYMFFFQLPFLPELTLKVNNFGSFETSLKACKLDDEDIKAYKHVFLQKGALTAPMNYYRALFQIGKVKHDLNYAMPVLLIWGVNDKALSPALAEEVVKENPKIVLKRIEEAGHFVQFEAPQEVNKIMREWLGQQ